MNLDPTKEKVGDRTKLGFDQRAMLETKILPTARDWLTSPALRKHGLQTLRYWQEPYPAVYDKEAQPS